MKISCMMRSRLLSVCVQIPEARDAEERQIVRVVEVVRSTCRIVIRNACYRNHVVPVELPIYILPAVLFDIGMMPDCGSDIPMNQIRAVDQRQGIADNPRIGSWSIEDGR